MRKSWHTGPKPPVSPELSVPNCSIPSAYKSILAKVNVLYSRVENKKKDDRARGEI